MSLKKFSFYLIRLIPAAVILLLFFSPITMESIELYDETYLPTTLFSFNLPFSVSPLIQTSVFKILDCAIYLLPLIAAFFIYTCFNKKIPYKVIYILTIAALSIYLFCSISSLIIFANTIRWFKNLEPVIYVLFFFAVISHITLTFFGMYFNRTTNPEYKDAKEIIKNINKKHRFSIKTKLILIVIGTILAILITFTLLILSGYKTQITEAVSDIGRAQSEQTAAVYETAEGENKKISSFFSSQKVSNGYASSPFDRIDIIISSINAQVFMEDITETTELPPFDTFAYSTGRRKSVPEDELTITDAQAREYIKRFNTGLYLREPIYNKARGTCKYIYPITLQRQAGRKLVGFSIVTYKEETLMVPYFKIKILVFSCSLIFLYISIVLILFLADFITNPLIFLRANVHRTSDAISQTISGHSKFSTESFSFEDTIKTNDEIKELSLEIDNTFSLIKGIVPYISFSTFKNADKGSSSSRSRDLCFLFTDIRGFTSLCENRSPKDIVEILNHYLDIETEIILNNNGDVDKFVGDEMMAFFSGPKKEYNACKAAMEIRAAMRKEQKQALKEGTDVISIGIGINSGKVVFGSVGSKSRLDFTSIGDTVNLAARLEGANKAYGSKSIITETVYKKLKDSFICRELDFITVKGKKEPVRIYEILQISSEAQDKLYEIKELFEKGLHLYRKQNWDKAQTYFTECAEKYNDMPSIIFLDRIKHFKKNPPDKKWDGVFVMSVK